MTIEEPCVIMSQSRQLKMPLISNQNRAKGIFNLGIKFILVQMGLDRVTGYL